MTVDELREFCLSLPHAKENHPWTEPQYENLATFTVGNKWFLLLDPQQKFVDVKASPEAISEMQQKYTGAFPAWHMNKEHWLGIRLESDIPDATIKALVTNAYNLIVASLPKELKSGIGV